MNYANVIKIIIAPENNKILDIKIYILFIFIRYL